MRFNESLRLRTHLAARVLMLAALLGACGDDGPTRPDGDVYHATTFEVRMAGVTTDLLARGADIDLVLQDDGRTSGRLYVPAFGGEPTFEASLAGTWTRNGSTVTLDHPADTFLRDMPFTVRADGALEGEEDFGGEVLRVVLARE